MQQVTARGRMRGEDVSCLELLRNEGTRVHKQSELRLETRTTRDNVAELNSRGNTSTVLIRRYCSHALFNSAQYLEQFIHVRNNDDFTVALSAYKSLDMCATITVAAKSSWVVV